MINSENTSTREDNEYFSSFREDLRTILQTDILQVTFTKRDGAERTLKCTLRPDFLPLPTAIKSHWEENKEILSVWDLDNDGWRSFRLDSVIMVNKAP